MQWRHWTGLSRIILVAAVGMALAGSSRSVAAGQVNKQPVQTLANTNQDDGGFFGKLLEKLVPSSVTSAAKKVDTKVETNRTQRDILGSVIAIMTLLVSGIPVLLKSYENLSIQSKTKDLDRIQSLIVLMEKTKKEKVLEAATLDRICAQIDQEILYALEAMERAREHRRQVLEKRQRSLEKKRARQDPELPFINSVLLLFRPHGPSAWLAHTVAFVSAFIVILGCVLAAARYNGEWGQWLSMAAISLVLCLLSRTWALWERKQWKTARATGIPIRTIFFRPRNVRTVLALLFAYWWLLLVVVSALACVTGAPEFYIVLVPSLLFFWLSRKWVLYERRRWDQKHPLAKPESAPRMAGMDKAEQAALPAGSA
jgi:hypothetical protein